MKVNWKVSPKLIEKIQKIKRLHLEGLSYQKIAEVLGCHRTYIHALLAWDRKMKGGESSEKQNS